MLKDPLTEICMPSVQSHACEASPMWRSILSQRVVFVCFCVSYKEHSPIVSALVHTELPE